MSGQNKVINKVTNIGTVLQAVFAALASVVRVAQAGLDWVPKGDIANAVRVGQHNPVMVFNSTGGVLYVAFGAQAMAAPTTASNGIPIAGGEKFVLSSGGSDWIRASAAGVFAYVGDN